ncbi:cupin-like domain-containing protein [Brevundimonas subvibrioides]|uniref:cupin-like domain-containing protein n=1 Tax=Brevundimonas subvibrioides TaxID=74313 RepID=UPI0022B51FFE|nr:cupin-like domain-containing protein [Brevundimonas subvibrioides]
MTAAIEERPSGQSLTLGDVEAGRPVVFRGLVRDWPAVVAAGRGDDGIAAYLSQLDRGTDAEVFVAPPGAGGTFFYADDLKGFNFTKQRATVTGLLRDLSRIADLADPPALYMGAAPMGDSLPAFSVENPPPPACEAAVPRLWLGNAVAVQTHYDLSDNIACIIAGTRTFTLFPPEQTTNLYVGPLEHTLAGQPVSLAPLDAPDLARFPKFADALAASASATLEPGDALYIPPLWWHHVRSHASLNVLVNYWWRSSRPEAGSPFECLVHALLSIRDLPDAQRSAWRSIFDHYVFDAEARDLSHIPEPARGILGPLSPTTASIMRRFIIGSMARS